MIEKYTAYLRNVAFLESTALGLFMVAGSLVINFYAVTYATIRASNPVTDIILSNTRVYDVDGFFVYGSIILWLCIIVVLLIEPRRIPFTLKSIALFVVIRSIFITLTHIGPFPTQVVIDPGSLVPKFIGKDLFFAFFTGNDLFFSGHTGLPFLLALIFWDNLYLRCILIGLSIIFGIVVLLGHLHYSIDVLSAFFITYTIYKIATVFFKKDRIMAFSSGLV